MLIKQIKRSLCVALLLVGMSLCGSAQAQVDVTSMPNLDLATGVYTYDFSVFNGSALELAIVTVPADQASDLMNLIAPTGFGITFDPGVGLVSFFEDNDATTPQTFAANSTIPGFSFTSTFGPGAVTFSALDIAGNETTGPTISAVVPEPTSTMILATGLALVASVTVFRRRAALRPVTIQ